MSPGIPEDNEIRKLLVELEKSSAPKINVLSFMQSKQVEIEELKNKATAGDVDAQLKLGLVFIRGHGTLQIIPQCKQWFQLAASNGNLTAKGYCSFNGYGQTENKEEAFRLFTQECKASKTNSDAMNMLGQCYLNGYGVKKDTKEAIQCFFKSAQLGCISAINNLGICFENGYGVSVSLELAFKWFMVSAKLGALTAMYNVGWFYQNAKFVPSDMVSAIFWLKSAADGGSEEGRQAVKRLVSFSPGLRWINEWSKIRLLWIGKLKSSESFFAPVPKEIIKEITRLLLILEYDFKKQ